MQSSSIVDSVWIGPEQAATLTDEEQEAYRLAHTIMCHLCVRAPARHKSGHPGGPLSAFTFAYFLAKRRNPHADQPLRMSAGHLSLLAYGLQWLFGREGTDKRLQSPQAIIETFRTPGGLPGHAEAGIGDIPFGAGPLGKGVSNGLGAAFGLKHLGESGTVDVLLADGDCQEGQVMEAFRLAARLKTDNLVVHGDFNDVQLSDLPSNVVAADFARIAAATGWRVIEVQNGNDPGQVVAALGEADKLVRKSRPIFICYYTTMGSGISLMEEGSNTGKENFHGTPLSAQQVERALRELPPLEETVKRFEPHRRKEKERYASGTPTPTDIPLAFDAGALQGYERAVTTEKGAARKDFGATHLLSLMKADERIVVLHADLAGSGGFDNVAEAFPDRVVNVGVAEANMVMMAAGMRQVGLLPVTYTFAAFGTNEARANARLIDMNCGHTRCAVLNDCTHSGINVGEDGETHQEQHYLNIPFYNTRVWMPCDSNQAGAMAERALALVAEGHTSVYVFSGRTSHEQLLDDAGNPLYGRDYVFDGKATTLRGFGDKRDYVTIIATGITVHEAIRAADMLKEQKIHARVLNVASIRPIDADAIKKAAADTGRLIVVEDHCTEGGLASRVADVIADNQLQCSLKRIGLSRYFPSGTANDLTKMAGLDAEGIVRGLLSTIHSGTV